MHCVKRLGQSLMARELARQVAEVQVRCAVLYCYTTLGRPPTTSPDCPGCWQPDEENRRQANIPPASQDPASNAESRREGKPFQHADFFSTLLNFIVSSQVFCLSVFVTTVARIMDHITLRAASC
ncbi:hypothetical protein SAMN05421772_110155 [Paracoccus saliphilus]|uniref:Uncharacterized protein n=1 Tax=Paracoccus saliphilus TaxID=405559 RepID=A0AA45W5Z8_9RHOB|nr:hypothetical protein SAMN05421772_110155 [Paracoccus saliphilus]